MVGITGLGNIDGAGLIPKPMVDIPGRVAAGIKGLGIIGAAGAGGFPWKMGTPVRPLTMVGTKRNRLNIVKVE